MTMAMDLSPDTRPKHGGQRVLSSILRAQIRSLDRPRGHFAHDVTARRTARGYARCVVPRQ